MFASVSLWYMCSSNNSYKVMAKRPGGACMSVVYRCVNKETTRKGTFSSWAVRSAVIIEGRKNAIFVEKGYVFLQFYKRLQK